MEYRYELHLHTSESSKCGLSAADSMMATLKAQKFTGVVITDHFVNANARVDRKADWPTQIDQILAGYRQAKLAGEALGLQVFLGWEYFSDWNDYLTFGLPEAFLYEHPELKSLAPAEYARLIHAHGGFIIHAHPFREAWYIPEDKWDHVDPKVIDAMEVFNAGNGEERYNEKAQQYARDHHLVMTAGSDTHSIDTVGSGYMVFPRRMNDAQDLVRSLRAQEGRMVYRRQRVAIN